jgi:hypothetical protein
LVVDTAEVGSLVQRYVLLFSSYFFILTGIHQDWTHDMSDVKGKGRATNSRATAAAEAIKKDAELRAQFVVIPPGGEANTIACPICKEVLNPEFVEDDEEWVWKNAVKKDDRVSALHSMSLANYTNISSLSVCRYTMQHVMRRPRAIH